MCRHLLKPLVASVPGIESGLPYGGRTGSRFLDRVKEAMTKAVREAKMYSNWSEPNEAYEEGLHEFTQQLLARKYEVPENVCTLCAAAQFLRYAFLQPRTEPW